MSNKTNPNIIILLRRLWISRHNIESIGVVIVTENGNRYSETIDSQKKLLVGGTK
jgi:hypothetical protein